MVTNTQHHFLVARIHKEDHYGSMLLDLQYAGFLLDLVTFEVGCLGHFMPATVTKFSNVYYLLIRCILQQAACVNCHLLFIQDI